MLHPTAVVTPVAPSLVDPADAVLHEEQVAAAATTGGLAAPSAATAVAVIK